MLSEKDDEFVDLCLKDRETRTRAVLQRQSQRRVFVVFSIFLAFVAIVVAGSGIFTDLKPSELTYEGKVNFFLFLLIILGEIILHFTWELRFLKFAERIAEKSEH